MSLGTKHQVDIHGLAFGGEGVARIEGKTVFVANALPGERCSIEIVESKKRFDRAVVEDVLVESKDRRQSDCPHEAEGCGGCGFRHVVDAKSLQLKTEAAMESVVRIASQVDWPKPTLHPAERLDGGRTRLRLHAESGRLGLFAKGSHTLVAIPGCLVAKPELLVAVAAVEAVLKAASNESPPNSVMLELIGGGVAVSWRGELGNKQSAGLEAAVNSGALRGVLASNRGKRHELGPTWFSEDLGSGESTYTTFRKAGTFGQANQEANQAMIAVLGDILSATGASRVLELFAGSGNFTAPMAGLVDRILAVEIDADGLDGLRKTCEHNQLSGVRLYRRDLSRGFTRKLRDTVVDTVVLDPPRTGAKELVTDLVRSAAVNLLYVSCSPTTLARDAAALASAFRVEAVHAFDMFPRTPQVEMLVHFVRV